MNKEELIAEILLGKRESIVEGSEHYDYPEYEDVVPVWKIKLALDKAFPPKSKDDDKHYKSSSCDRDEQVDMGDVDEY
mgnify:FL=1|jgi:hypothetical protein|tara:strand:- start:1862 stop:2095 length:234 start_codon:yes stop_codon:yes gene_type:complete